ncbi:MAG: hypothetical protein AB7R55_04930 [Gemmatimonadales bacterium]
MLAFVNGLPPAAVGLLALLALIAAALVWERGQRNRLLARLRARWGRPAPVARYPEVIGGYHRWLAQQRAPDASIDERTAADLHFEELFAAVDHTLSGIGRQVLYDRLRHAEPPPDSALVGHLADRVTGDAALRERLQLLLVRLEDTATYGLWQLTMPGAIPTDPRMAVLPFLTAGIVGSMVAIPFFPPATLALIGFVVVGLLLRTSLGWKLNWLLPTVRQLAGFLAVAKRLARVQHGSERVATGVDAADVIQVEGIRKLARWAGGDRTGAGGELLAMFQEYLNLVLLLDGNVLFFASRQLERKADVILRLLGAVGRVDTALAIASYRSSVRWVRPRLDRDRSGPVPLELRALRHPLLDNPVPNDLTVGAERGMVVTGSNMSGKSTYLRTVGVTVVMAQTMETCLADRYSAPVLRVRSAIGRSDDLLAGKSYYLAEVEAVIEMVTRSAEPTPTLMLFDELFRGTNAVERIAAGAAVLRELLDRAAGASPHVVLVATHDGELVDLLADHGYRPVHFEESVDAEGISFDYLLKPGPARTRNAIALLEQRGAPARLIETARTLAVDLDRSRGGVEPAT